MNGCIKNVPRLLDLHAFEDALNLICRKATVAPIYVENWIDDELTPLNFTFHQGNLFHSSAHKAIKSLTLNIDCGCRLATYCKRGQCCARKFSSNKHPYQNSRLNNDNDRIVECSSECLCDRNCPLRLVQVSSCCFSANYTKKLFCREADKCLLFCSELLIVGGP